MGRFNLSDLREKINGLGTLVISFSKFEGPRIEVKPKLFVISVLFGSSQVFQRSRHLSTLMAFRDCQSLRYLPFENQVTLEKSIVVWISQSQKSYQVGSSTFSRK